MTPDLDKLIEEYSKKLMDSIPEEQLKKSSINTEPTEAVKEEQQTAESTAEEGPTEDMPEENEAVPFEEERVEEEKEEGTIIPDVDTDPENYSTFVVRVFSGGGAYPVPEAKVVLYRGDTLEAFLTTNKSGETPQIKIASYPAKNSLEPLSDEQRLNYSADVFADGFTEKRNLLISAVGGADVVLNVELVPESEGIN
ncbi:MAG: hypothetical protein UHM85_01355 [Acutalibacteraceae bacterium]|nr:hypothetical protein [Acutalibacteraceae bacterium]